MNREEWSEMLRENERMYDESVQLLRVPMNATYHTALKAETHPYALGLYVSAQYAYQLLQDGEQTSANRAAQILRRLLPLQDRDPARSTYGIWPYFYEESLDEMDRPDWNMADFHGKLLCLILKRHAGQLPEDLLAQIREAVHHACQAIIRRNVGPGYTNIAIMGAFVTLAGGELLGDEEIRSYGLARLTRFAEYTDAVGTFSEYNSPTYTIIAIQELHTIDCDCDTREAVRLAQELLDVAWEMIAVHYHAPTAAWGGPHSRTYSTELRLAERRFLDEALLNEMFEFGENIRCPLKYRKLFAKTEQRYFTEPTMPAAETGYQVHATYYQNERVSLGTFSRGVMWNQRRNLLAYVNADGRSVYVQLQFLMNGRDFCSAMFTGVQDRACVLFGINLLTDNGAWHSELDKIDGRFQASDLRIRLNVGGETEGLEPPQTGEGNTLRIRLGQERLVVRPVFERFDEGRLTAEIGHGEDGSIYLDYIIYAGEERAFDFHAVCKAVWVFALALNPDGELPDVSVTEAADSVSAAFSEHVSIRLAAAPGKTQELYALNQVSADTPRRQIRY